MINDTIKAKYIWSHVTFVKPRISKNSVREGTRYPSIHVVIMLYSLSIHAYIHGCMHAWMDGWMDGWMDASIHPSIHPSIHACMHPCMYACIEREYNIITTWIEGYLVPSLTEFFEILGLTKVTWLQIYFAFMVSLIIPRQHCLGWNQTKREQHESPFY